MAKSGIYTRKGDTGQTTLGDRSVVSKTDCRVEAVGAVDELNSMIGLACAYCAWSKDLKFYQSLQSDLFVIGAIVGGCELDLRVDQERIAFLEEMIDEVSATLESLKNFILPGGDTQSAWLHWLRSVCRRAERAVVAASQEHNLDRNVIVFMNRLSDLFFVYARKHNELGKKDILWHK